MSNKIIGYIVSDSLCPLVYANRNRKDKALLRGRRVTLFPTMKSARDAIDETIKHPDETRMSFEFTIQGVIEL